MQKTNSTAAPLTRIPSMQSEDMTVIYVIDDHPMMREAISAMLRRQFAATRVIEFSSLAEAKAGSASFPTPDVICLDLNLGDSQGPRGVSEIKALHPYAPLIVISGSSAAEMEDPCLQAGADVYIEKSAGSAEIRATLRALIAPESEFDESEMLGSLKLSKRQKQLIAMLDYGFSNREIATELGLSEHTVKVHLLRLFRRLGVNSRTQALHVARLNGLLS
ncbi:response regulator transcription factor [Comamonas serinivorans]